MKRKFSFKLAPTKVPTANEEGHTMDGVDSPPFSPVSFIIERPHLSPQIYSELQRSCASIVQELQPVDHHVYESIAAANKFPRKWSDDNQAYKAVTQTQPSKPKSHRRTDSAPIFPPKPYTHIPTNAATSFKATATTRKPSYAIEPVEPTHPSTFLPPTTSTRFNNVTALPSPPHDPLAHIRADIATRPKTSAAACIDYAPPSATSSTSTSTSRSNTTYEAATTTTGQTSLALTPGSSRLSSSQPPLSSTSQPDAYTSATTGAASSAAAAATAKAWMAQELARRRSEAEKVAHQRAQHNSGVGGGITTNATSRPSARGSVSDPGPRGREDVDRALRSRSRSGSITRGIKDYIRPRGGSVDVDSVRTTGWSQSSTDVSGISPGNHTASINKWSFSTALKRKGSWSSFRSSSRLDNEGSEGSEDGARAGGGGGSPDLNRALPALPGLDSWRGEGGEEGEKEGEKEKEKGRRRPRHVGLMMRAGVGVAKKEVLVTPPPLSPLSPLFPGRQAGSAVVDGAAERGRACVGATFSERIRTGGLELNGKHHVKSVNPTLQNIHPLLRPQPQPQPAGVGRGSAVGVGEKSMQAAAMAECDKENEKKLGLRKRLSRFWGRGMGRAGGKGELVGAGVGVGVAVVAN